MIFYTMLYKNQIDEPSKYSEESLIEFDISERLYILYNYKSIIIF